MGFEAYCELVALGVAEVLAGGSLEREFLRLELKNCLKLPLRDAIN
jgi:hypothetical protein